MLPGHWKLPKSLRDRLGREAGPQRMMLEEGHLLIVLHQLPKPGDQTRQGVYFWRNLEGGWSASTGGKLDALAAHFELFEKALARMTDAEYNASSARQYHDVLTELTPICRTVRHAKEVMQKAREAMPDDERLIDLRDRAAGLERTADLLLQDAGYGLNFTVARRSEEEADAARRLNVLAAIFLPLTAASGLFSMTMKSGTGFEDWPSSFWVVAGGGLLVGLMLARALGRRR